jgi:hypothetical protein
VVHLLLVEGGLEPRSLRKPDAEVSELKRRLHDVVGEKQGAEELAPLRQVGTAEKRCRPAAVPTDVSKDVPP